MGQTKCIACLRKQVLGNIRRIHLTVGVFRQLPHKATQSTDTYYYGTMYVTLQAQCTIVGQLSVPQMNNAHTCAQEGGSLGASTESFLTTEE